MKVYASSHDWKSDEDVTKLPRSLLGFQTYLNTIFNQKMVRKALDGALYISGDQLYDIWNKFLDGEYEVYVDYAVKPIVDFNATRILKAVLKKRNGYCFVYEPERSMHVKHVPIYMTYDFTQKLFCYDSVIEKGIHKGLASIGQLNCYQMFYSVVHKKLYFSEAYKEFRKTKQVKVTGGFELEKAIEAIRYDSRIYFNAEIELQIILLISKYPVLRKEMSKNKKVLENSLVNTLVEVTGSVEEFASLVRVFYEQKKSIVDKFLNLKKYPRLLEAIVERCGAENSTLKEELKHLPTERDLEKADKLLLEMEVLKKAFVNGNVIFKEFVEAIQMVSSLIELDRALTHEFLNFHINRKKKGITKNEMKESFAEYRAQMSMTDFFNNSCALKLNLKNFYSDFKITELATKLEVLEEGKNQRHCVGDYWNDVLRGTVKIFHLESSSGVTSTLALALKNEEIIISEHRLKMNKPVTIEFKECATKLMNYIVSSRQLEQFELQSKNYEEQISKVRAGRTRV